MKLMSYNILDGGENRIPEIIKVIKNELSHYASDHYPTVVELD